MVAGSRLGPARVHARTYLRDLVDHAADMVGAALIIQSEVFRIVREQEGDHAPVELSPAVAL